MNEIIYALDDEQSILELYQATFSMSGYQCRTFADVPSFYAALKEQKPSLILLDIMLPGEDGLSILRRLQESDETKDIPVIMVSAKGAETDKVLGLNSGACDYLAKPFGVLELVARVKANLRKSHSQTTLEYKDLAIDEKGHQILLKGTPLVFSETEYSLLCYLILHSRTVLSKDVIMADVWGMDQIVETRSLDMFISHLRKKLASSSAIIETVRSVGYVLK